MKKILFLFIVSMLGFVGCSKENEDDNNWSPTGYFDNWNNPKSPNYKPDGYNPILGDWVSKSSTGLTIRFTNDFKYMHGWSDVMYFTFISKYVINDKEFMAYDSKASTFYTVKYLIDMDTLTTTGNTTLKYYRVKKTN